MKSPDFCIVANKIQVVNFHVQVNAASCGSKFEVHHVMAEQLFNALKAIETQASGTMKLYGLPLHKGLNHRNYMALAPDCPRARARTAGMIVPRHSEGHIIPAVVWNVQALAGGQSKNFHRALSLGYYCIIKDLVLQLARDNITTGVSTDSFYQHNYMLTSSFKQLLPTLAHV